MAGVPGFEPGNAGIKIPCLTTWLHPNTQTAPKRSSSGERSRPSTQYPRHPAGRPASPAWAEARSGISTKQLAPVPLIRARPKRPSQSRTSPTTGYRLPDNDPSLVVTVADDDSVVGRAGMRYRDLIPDRWGGRFISSHITIPDGGPVPDYVHFHKIRFQLIFVKAGWVRVVYEDQGEPFVMLAGDCVLQPPEIRHRVLESSPGLEVVEIGCPAEHETIADWSIELPTQTPDRTRDFGGQRFVRHIAAEASYEPWRVDGWEFRDTGIAAATDGLAGVRVARPTDAPVGQAIAHDSEFTQLVVLAGSVGFEAEGTTNRLTDAESVAIPGGTPYRLVDPSSDCELLDVTMPAVLDVRAS